VTLDKPWRRPGRAAYARKRIRAFVKPPITVVAAPADLRKLHDVPVTMRDGVRLRANVYLPTGDGPFPVILSAHPYGKDKLPKRRGKRWSFSFQFRIMNQPQPYQISSETGWEAPDPVWWTQHGYAVINADLRGAGTSEGTGTTLSDLEGRDVYDLIEWAGSEAWSIGKVGMLGVSYLALSQYTSVKPSALVRDRAVGGFHRCVPRLHDAGRHRGERLLRDLADAEQTRRPPD
jgi:predicted acyl esterase